MLQQAGISDFIYEASFEEHIGTVANIDENVVRRNLEMFKFHPIKGLATKATVQNIVTIFEKALKRFEQNDIFDLEYPNSEFFLLCFDLACIDLANLELQIKEAQFR